MTRLDIPVTYNFRQVTGTRAGSLYRSDALATLSRDGRAEIAGLGVSRVIDLRNTLDRRLGGRDKLRGTGARQLKIPMMSTAPRSELQHVTLDRLYVDLLDNNADAFGAVLRAAADAPYGAVVIHCTAGKDRTGLSAALIQHVLGVDEATILADYALTEANLEGEWADRMHRKIHRFRVTMTPDLEQVLVGSPPDTLAGALTHLRATYGGIDEYLRRAGVSDAHLDRLRERFHG